jgi:8-oxo-dGTP diphosphatase
MVKKETTLAYIYNNHHYLMLFRNKKENDINKGKWIGIGGHLEENETITDCIIREVKEETGLDVIDPLYRGKILFESDDIKEIMHLYLIKEFKGEIKECNEGELHYIHESKLLDLPMWEGDKIFLPLLINTDEFIKLHLIYKEDKLIDVIHNPNL